MCDARAARLVGGWLVRHARHVILQPYTNLARVHAFGQHDGRSVFIRFDLLGVAATAVAGKPGTILVNHVIEVDRGTSAYKDSQFRSFAFRFHNESEARRLVQLCASFSHTEEVIFEAPALMYLRSSRRDGGWRDLGEGDLSIIRNPANGTARACFVAHATRQTTQLNLEAALTQVVPMHPKHFFLNGTSADGSGTPMKVRWKLATAEAVRVFSALCDEYRGVDGSFNGNHSRLGGGSSAMVRACVRAWARLSVREFE